MMRRCLQGSLRTRYNYHTNLLYTSLHAKQHNFRHNGVVNTAPSSDKVYKVHISTVKVPSHRMPYVYAIALDHVTRIE